MEEKLLKCPNCGANATNHQNCEYCGSLLVRFVDKGIDLSKTTYTSNAEVFPGLIAELEQNLRLQESNPNVNVVTDIWREKEKVAKWTSGLLISVGRSGYSQWVDGKPINNSGEKTGLCICLNFEQALKNWARQDEEVKMNEIKSSQIKKFKKLKCYSLFTYNSCKYEVNVTPYVSYEYAIDFGRDIEGAARLISEIMRNVLDVTSADNPEIKTNVGEMIEISRKEEDEARERNGGTWDKMFGFIILFVILYIISSLVGC